MLRKIRLGNAWPAPACYALALGIFAIALTARYAVRPDSEGLPFLTFYPALLVCCLICGTGPSLMLLFASAATAYFAFRAPQLVWIYKPEGVIDVAVFLLTGLGCIVVVRWMHTYCDRWQLAIADAQRSERRYLGVIEDQTEMIFRYVRDGTLVFVNDACCRQIGKPRGELLGQAWTLIPIADDQPQFKRQLELLTQHNPIATVDSRFRSSDGEDRWGQFVNRAFFDEGGNLSEIQSVGRDITEHRRLAAALDQARSAAVRANEFKSRFLAAASHDLRQPLQTIWSLHTVLVRSTQHTDLAPHLALLEDSVRSMDETLRALMDVNRLETGAIVPVMRDFALRESLSRLRSEFAFAASSKSISLDIEDSAESAHSDPMLLPVILRNLLGNAIKYTQRGGVRLCVRAEGPQLYIDIIDSGVGIPPEHLQRVFDAFYQIDNSTRDQRRGVGLGLSIVQNMCKLLGHTITIDSRVDEGSTFTVQMTRGAAAAAPAAHRAPTAPAARKRPNGIEVLHIEDDPGVARSMALLLGLEGYKITSAASRDEALRRVQGDGLRPDLILCDFQLPMGYTGDRIVAEIAVILGFKPPTIMLTGDIADSHVERAKQIADRILPKPVDIELLLREFDALLGARQ